MNEAKIEGKVIIVLHFVRMSVNTFLSESQGVEPTRMVQLPANINDCPYG